jgi:hypothetical protein
MPTITASETMPTGMKKVGFFIKGFLVGAVKGPCALGASSDGYAVACGNVLGDDGMTVAPGEIKVSAAPQFVQKALSTF